MQVLKEGKANLREAWFTTCPNCESELKILIGDPHCSRVFYNCDRRQYWIRYKCPVCNSLQIAHTRSTFGGSCTAEIKVNYALNEKDRIEINSWKDEKVTEEETHWFNICSSP